MTSGDHARLPAGVGNYERPGFAVFRCEQLKQPIVRVGQTVGYGRFGIVIRQFLDKHIARRAKALCKSWRGNQGYE